MSEKCYFISEASKMVGVEAHVLRYWEEQLGLEIKRNEMGHRYYIDEDIRLLQNIKQVMAKGIQLRAVKMLLPGLLQHGEEAVLDLMEEDAAHLKESEESSQMASEGQGGTRMQEKEQALSGEVVVKKEEEVSPEISRELKLARFQEMMSNLIGQALQQNNSELAAATSERVSERVIKEVDYLMRVRENQEEERYKKLDETIRSLQRSKGKFGKDKEGKRGFRKGK